jgi:hypothetical protein
MIGAVIEAATKSPLKSLIVALFLALAACQPTASSDPVARGTKTDDLAPTTVSPSAPSGDPLTSLRGNTRNAIAWAPLSDPDNVSVEGSVPSSRAWSTSKVLVIAAYLDTVVDGAPAHMPARERTLITKALAESDGAAIAAIRSEIPGSPGAAMTRVLREVGDTTTRAPDSYEGTMQWSVREQVRFLAALDAGKVVSPAASRFLLTKMQPIAAHRWGLGAIGASAFKPGWYRPGTETRQMGIVGDYAVAIITAGDGPAVRQSDGDYAHVWQMNRLADLLARRIGQR